MIVPATIALVIAVFETQLFYPPPSHARTTGIVWHGSTFTTRADFARWLRTRGVRYRVWARRHPALVPPSPSRAAQQSAGAERAGQNGSAWSVGVLGGGLAVLASLGLVAVFLRRRRPGGRGGAGGQTVRLATGLALLAAKGGARLMLRWAAATALLLSSLAASSAKVIRRRGPEFARFLAHRAAPSAKGGARLMLRWATAIALMASSVAASSANTIRRRRSEFAWYLVTALLAVGIGVVATVWLNGA